MDPISIVTIVGAAGSLAIKCGKVIHTLYELMEKHKHAEITIMSIIQECRTIELAWSRIGRWAANGLDDYDDEQLGERLQLSLYSGQLVMAELEKDLTSFHGKSQHSKFRRKAKIVWSEHLLQDHQNRLRGQVCAMILLLDVIQLPSRSDRADLLSIKEPVFRSADDSVRSIVPSRLSRVENDASSFCSSEGEELWYIPFAFENQLFTSNVYKRNFRVPQIRNLHQNVRIESSCHNSLATPVIIKDAASSGILQGECAVEDSLAQDPNVLPNIRHSRNDDELESISDYMLVSAITPNTLPYLDDIHPKENTINPASLISSDSRNEGGSGGMSEHIIVSAIPPDTLPCFEDVRPSDNPIAFASPISSDSGPIKLLNINNPTQNEIGVQGSSLMPMSIKRKPVALTHNVLQALQSTHPTSSQKGTARRGNPKTTCQHKSLVKIDHLESFLDLFITTQESQNVVALKAIQHLECQRLVAPTVCTHCIFTNSDIGMMFQKIAEQEISLFSTIMQTAAFTYGSQVLRELVESFTAAEHETPRIGYMSTQHSAITLTHWTNKILEDPEVYWAAAHRDEAVAANMLRGPPTALQLACLTKRFNVVEYLLANGLPTFTFDWTVNPFILATKRRCRPILELFFKLAHSTITDSIKNLALIMVVNQDCILSEGWMGPNQNENKRCGEDVNIVSLLLTHGASPNVRDKHGISVLSLAIRSGYNSNQWSLQIVNILLRKGAIFGLQEQVDVKAGPQAFHPILRRHKLDRIHPLSNTSLSSEVCKNINHKLFRLWKTRTNITVDTSL